MVVSQMVVVVDDEDRENEGDLIMAATLVTPEAMAFIVKHGTGIVCVSMKEEDLERLQLPQMVTSRDNEEKLRTAFTVSVVSTSLERSNIDFWMGLFLYDDIDSIFLILERMQNMVQLLVYQLVIEQSLYKLLHPETQSLRTLIVQDIFSH